MATEAGASAWTKRKVALVVGYQGLGFRGFQMDRKSADQIRTVERELEAALHRCGAISDANYGDLTKIAWTRTSRTDKGVHAARNVVAAKLLIDQSTFGEDGTSNAMKERINSELPEDLRVFSVCKTWKSFRGRRECTWRSYEYYLPLALLAPEGTEQAERLSKFDGLLQTYIGKNSFHNFVTLKKPQGSGNYAIVAALEDDEDDTEAEESVSSEESVNSGAEETTAPPPLWRASQRFEDATSTAVYVCECDSTGETAPPGFLRLRICGQAFFYNQIRYMIGAALAEATGALAPGTVAMALQAPFRVPVPLAPAQGLVLWSQAFTRFANAAVLEPELLEQLDGVVVRWTGHGEESQMRSLGRLQAFMTEAAVEEANAFHRDQILPALAGAWEEGCVEEWDDRCRRCSAQHDEMGDQIGKAWAAHTEEAAVAAEARLQRTEARRAKSLAAMEGSENATNVTNRIDYRSVLPKVFATQLMSRYHLIPSPRGKLVGVQRALARRLVKSGRAASTEELMDMIAKEGVDALATEGGFRVPALPTDSLVAELQ